MSTRRIGSSSIGGGGGGSNVRYQTDETPGTVVGELWVDSDGTSNLVNSNDYLTRVDASAEYLSSISASNTYLSQDSASATYATQTSLTDGLASKLAAADQKIIQVVRDTDSGDRTTTSTTYTDVTGVAVTITPTKNTSAILLLMNCFAAVTPSGTADTRMDLAITDNSNNIISGGERRFGLVSSATAIAASMTVIAYATPATTSAVTYKLRFKSLSASTTAQIFGPTFTTQLYAIEIGT